MPSVLGGPTPHEWDELAGRHLYSSAAWLRLCTAGHGVPLRLAAAIATDGSSRAAVPMAGLPAGLPPGYDWDGLLTGRGLPALSPRRVLVGPPRGYQTHLLGHTDPGLVRSLLARIREIAPDIAGGEPVSTVAMFLSTGDVTRLQAAGVEAEPVLIEPDAWLHVPPGGWNEWLAGLRKGQRYRVRDEVGRFEAAGHEIRDVPLATCWQRLPPLAVELARKLGFNADQHRFEREFREYAEFTEDSRVLLCESKDGDLLGFAMYYLRGETVYLRWAALDYPRIEESHAEYFNVAYYQLVRLAGERGLTRVHLGKKVLDAKVFRGARLYPLWLLDLSPDSPLAAVGPEVRASNARVLAGLTADPRLVGAVEDLPSWEKFC